MDDSWLLPQVVCTDVKCLLDAPYLPNVRGRVYFPQGAVYSEYIRTSLPTQVLAGFVSLSPFGIPIDFFELDMEIV